MLISFIFKLFQIFFFFLLFCNGLNSCFYYFFWSRLFLSIFLFSLSFVQKLFIVAHFLAGRMIAQFCLFVACVVTSTRRIGSWWVWIHYSLRLYSVHLIYLLIYSFFRQPCFTSGYLLWHPSLKICLSYLNISCIPIVIIRNFFDFNISIVTRLHFWFF